MVMQAEARDDGILLTWTQDDFDTLSGYNVYRAKTEDGQYESINPTMIPADTKMWLDTDVEPGEVYYYNFDVVKTDLSLSFTSPRISVRAKDTMAPLMYHEPVYTAFTGRNLMITATVTDNVAVQSAKLFYRTAGETTYRTIAMDKLNDRYSAIIISQYVTTKGLEYYIEAYDGINYTYKGSAVKPYTVTVSEAVDNSSKGDVDGDGKVTLLDALLILQQLNGLYNLSAEEFARADLNGDGQLSAAEALRIVQYVNGMIGSVLYEDGGAA